MTAQRQTVDLSAYPDLIVVYLGMRVNVLTGIKTLLGFGTQNREFRGRSARRVAAAREHCLLVISAACRNAPILA